MGSWGITMRESDYGLDLLGILFAAHMLGPHLLLQLQIFLQPVTLCFNLSDLCAVVTAAKAVVALLAGGS